MRWWWETVGGRILVIMKVTCGGDLIVAEKGIGCRLDYRRGRVLDDASHKQISSHLRRLRRGDVLRIDCWGDGCPLTAAWTGTVG